MSLLKDKKAIYNAGIEAGLEYHKNTNRVKKNNPGICLKISPFGMPFVPLELSPVDCGGLIESWQMQKSRSTPAGVCNFTLIGNNEAVKANLGRISGVLNDILKALKYDLREIFKPRTLIQVWKDGYHVQTGFVKSVERNVDAETGVRYEITMEELGVIYQEKISTARTVEWGLKQNIFSNPSYAIDQRGNAALGGVFLWIYLNQIVTSFLTSMIFYPKMSPPWQLASDGLPLGLRFIALPPPLGGISTNSLVSTATASKTIFEASNGSSLWDLMRELCPMPWMELFTESGGRTICIGRQFTSGTAGGSNLNSGLFGANVGSSSIPTIPGLNVTATLPGFSYLIARSTPYDIPWIGIPLDLSLQLRVLSVMDLLMTGDFVIITDDDVISKNLRNSDEGQYTVFYANYNSRASSTKGRNEGRPSVANGNNIPFATASLRTFGSREYMAGFDSSYNDIGGIIGEQLTELEDIYGSVFKPGEFSLSTLLNTWFRNASKFNEGTITTRSIPYARPGMVLLYLPTRRGELESPKDIELYYIDNISEQGAVGENDTTTFSVIRGVPLPTSLDGGEFMRWFTIMMKDWEIMPPMTNYNDFM